MEIKPRPHSKRTAAPTSGGEQIASYRARTLGSSHCFLSISSIPPPSGRCLTETQFEPLWEACGSQFGVVPVRPPHRSLAGWKHQMPLQPEPFFCLSVMPPFSHFYSTHILPRTTPLPPPNTDTHAHTGGRHGDHPIIPLGTQEIESRG